MSTRTAELTAMKSSCCSQLCESLHALFCIANADSTTHVTFLCVVCRYGDDYMDYIRDQPQLGLHKSTSAVFEEVTSAEGATTKTVFFSLALFENSLYIFNWTCRRKGYQDHLRPGGMCRLCPAACSPRRYWLSLFLNKFASPASSMHPKT